MNSKNVLFEQLSKDYNCEPEVFLKGGVYFTHKKYIEGRRAYKPHIPSFSLVTTGKTLVIMADDNYFDWAQETFGKTAPQWITEFPNLAKIEKKLNEFGEIVADCHGFYLPHNNFHKAAIRDDLKIKFYNQEEIEQFKGDEKWNEAYAFNPSYPDILGVSAQINGELVAMAGASRDSGTMYQIGIKVIEKAEGKGIAAYLTNLLKEKVVECGAVPFYGTAYSHMASQGVALKSGFYPVWTELYSAKLNTQD